MEKKKLTSPFSLIGKAFEIFFKGENFGYLIKMTLAQFLVGILAAAPLLILFLLLGGATYFAESNSNSTAMPLIFVPLFILMIAEAMIIGSWLGAVALTAVSQIVAGKILGVKETLKLGWSKVWKFLGVSFVMGLIVMAGWLLFVIPGIIFGIWFSMALFLVVDKNLGLDALGKSKKLVSGHLLGVFGRMLLFGVVHVVIYLILSFIPFIGPILTILFAPFYSLLAFLLYKDVLRVKEG